LGLGLGLGLVSDIAVFVLKRDDKLQPTNLGLGLAHLLLADGEKSIDVKVKVELGKPVTVQCEKI